MVSIEKRPLLLEAFSPILGVYMTCMAMCGNGARIGMTIILQAMLLTLLGLKMVLSVSCAAAAGTATPGTAVPRTASGSPLASGLLATAFGLSCPQVSNRAGSTEKRYSRMEAVVEQAGSDCCISEVRGFKMRNAAKRQSDKAWGFNLRSR